MTSPAKPAMNAANDGDPDPERRRVHCDRRATSWAPRSQRGRSRSTIDLSGAELSAEEIVHCAARAGLKAKRVRMTWRGLSHLRKALPVVVTLTSGGSMVLESLEGSDEALSVILLDPNAGEDAKLVVDQQNFENAWTREVVLLRRNYDLADEDQPFSLSMIAGLIMRERRIVRDLAICAMALSLFALAPIVFWRLLSDKVIYYGSLNTFTVLCIAMGVVIVFETIFAYLRSYLVLFITARVDVRLSEYLMDNVLKLPIDYFERTQVGIIGRDMNEIWRVRTFLTGQLFGTVLDSLTLFVFLPVMFFFSPLLTLVVLVLCALIVGWLVMMLPHYRKRTSAVLRAEGERGAFLFQTLQGIRTVKSLSLEDRQRRQWDVHVARIAKLKLEEGFLSAIIYAGVRPLERLAVNGAYALGVYFAITTHDPVYIGALFAFLMLTQRVSGPLLKMAQLINQYDEARSAITIVGKLVNQPKEEGNRRSRRPLPALWPCRIREGSVQIPRRDVARARQRLLRSSDRAHVRHRRPQRVRQDHSHAPASAAALRLRRPHQGRWDRRTRIQRQPSQAQSGRGAAGEFPVQRHDPREHHGRQTACDLRRGGQGGAPRRRRGVHRSASARLRNAHLRGVAKSVGRPAAETCDRAGADPRPENPDPRRGNERARSRQRGDRQREHPPDRQPGGR